MNFLWVVTPTPLPGGAFKVEAAVFTEGIMEKKFFVRSVLFNG